MLSISTFDTNYIHPEAITKHLICITSSVTIILKHVLIDK